MSLINNKTIEEWVSDYERESEALRDLLNAKYLDSPAAIESHFHDLVYACAKAKDLKQDLIGIQGRISAILAQIKNYKEGADVLISSLDSQRQDYKKVLYDK